MKFLSIKYVLGLILFAALLALPSKALGANTGVFVDCITVRGSNVTAFFGYSNRNTTNETLTAGTSLNQFIPLPSNRFQPSTFLPGTHHFVFSVVFPVGTQLTWILDNSIAVADNNYPPCQDQSFTYQGRLTDGSIGANGSYQMQFSLFDADTGGNQIGSTAINNNVTVTGGIFSVPIDVASTAAFNGADRYLEIQVKRPADASFTTLSPRQKITSTPYALHSVSASTAEIATNAALFGMRTPSDFVLAGDARLTDARTPTAGSSNYIQNRTTQQAASNFNISGNGVIGGNLTITGTLNGTVPNYIQNSTGLQPASNFHISGDGIVGGTASATTVDVVSQYNLGGVRVLGVQGTSSTFAGIGAGQGNSSGDNNTFFGRNAGFATFTGASNTFFGTAAGRGTTSGNNNSFFGHDAGLNNTTGDDNVFVGRQAGQDNTTENSNTYIGTFTTGSPGVTNATAIGANAVVSRSNAVILGSIFGVNGAAAGIDVGIGTSNPQAKLHVVGNVRIDGNLSKSSGSFQIDHPLDPANKYLYHSFVESPDMMNIYNGIVTLDRKGRATVTMPEWFEALNQDFRYQLTCIGGFAPVYIAAEVKSNQFKIAGGRPGMKVSWQVTGIRHDAYANAHRIPVEEEKSTAEQGTYLHPELFKKKAANTQGSAGNKNK